MAKKMGATYTLKVTSRDPMEMAQKIEELMDVMPEITIECSGATPSIQTAIYVSMSHVYSVVLDFCVS